MKTWITLIAIAISIFIIITSCSRSTTKVLMSTSSLTKTYFVKDSQQFHHIDALEHVESIKEYEIAITPITVDSLQACFSCNINYYLNCACVETPTKEGEFCITYNTLEIPKSSRKFNDNIEVRDVTNPTQVLAQFVKDSLKHKSCDEQMSLAKKYSTSEKALRKKLRYDLSKIHRFDNVSVKTPALGYFESGIESVNFGHYYAVKDRANFNLIDNKRLKIWESSHSAKDQVLLRVLSSSDAGTTTQQDIGDRFLERSLDVFALDSCSTTVLEVVVDTSSNYLVSWKEEHKMEGKRWCRMTWEEFKLRQ